MGNLTILKLVPDRADPPGNQKKKNQISILFTFLQRYHCYCSILEFDSTIVDIEFERQRFNFAQLHSCSWYRQFNIISILFFENIFDLSFVCLFLKFRKMVAIHFDKYCSISKTSVKLFIVVSWFLLVSFNNNISCLYAPEPLDDFTLGFFFQLLFVKKEKNLKIFCFFRRVSDADRSKSVDFAQKRWSWFSFGWFDL